MKAIMLELIGGGICEFRNGDVSEIEVIKEVLALIAEKNYGTCSVHLHWARDLYIKLYSRRS